MSWQDIVYSICTWLCSVSLIFSIRNKKNKPDIKTSAITGIATIGFMIVQASLGLRLAAISTAVTLCMWIVLLLQVLLKKP